MTTTQTTTPYLDLEELEHVLARPFNRVSKDESGRMRSNAEQQADAEEVASRKRTWSLGPSYEDHGSASRYRAKRERVVFERLLTDLRSGTFGAHVLIVWETSRASREVEGWIDLIRACENARVFIFVTSQRRLFNPSVARDWKALMDEAVDAEYEVRRSSERILRSSKADAAAGRFTGGRRPYGYEPDGVTERKSEGNVIREAARLLLGGKSVRWIAGYLNGQGLPTSAGNAWHPGPLGKLLASQRVAGHRVHEGVIVKRDAWDAILDPETHARVAAVLATRSPTGRQGRTAWMLTGLLRCGKCGANLLGNTDSRNGVRRYTCRSGTGFSGCGGLGIAAKPLEDLLGALATERLADAQARHEARVTESDEAERAELERIAVARATIARELTAGEMSREDAKLERAELNAAQKAAERALAMKARDPGRLDFIATEEFVGRAWEELDPSDQRVVLDALLDHVTVTPSLRRGTTKFEPERVRGGIAWKA